MKKVKLTNDQDFFDKYMSALEPVVITNLFEGESIRNVNTKEKAITRWGDTPIGIQAEYSQSYKSTTGKKEPGSKQGEQTIVLAEYFDFVAKNPETKMMCIEFPCPDDFKQSYSIPSICTPKDGESQDFVNQCFVGNQGNFAHIHFDKAGTHGFLYQVFGRKKFIIFPKESTQKLAPFTQISAWNLENFTKKEHQDFLDYTGAQEVVLEPGEAVYVPAMCWHYADYVDDSMSISLRFRRPYFLTQLVNYLFPDFCLQYIAQTIQNQVNADGEFSWVFAELEKEWRKDYKNGIEKVSAMRKLANAIFYDLSPAKLRQGPYAINLEQHFPAMLPDFLNADKRKVYR